MSCSSFPSTMSTSGNPQNGSRAAMPTWSIEESQSITMGCVHLCDSKERWNSVIHLRLLRTQQADSACALSNPSHPKHVNESGRISTCYQPGFEHGLLPFRVKHKVSRALCCSAAIWKVRIPSFTNVSPWACATVQISSQKG